MGPSVRDLSDLRWRWYCDLGAILFGSVLERSSHLKVDHQLIRSGPYAYVRHPLYAGLLVAMAGTALVVGEWRAVLGVLVGLMEFSRKAGKEEALLTTEFNQDYQEYRRHTGFLGPRFR
jgi:protein-S-isoprenylcysteine O-methyltransferase Ste14